MYFCTNSKYNLFHSVQLIVRPNKLEKHPEPIGRLRRAQFGNQGTNVWNGQAGSFSQQIPPINRPDPVRDFFEGNKATSFHSPSSGGSGGIYNQWAKDTFGSGNSYSPYNPNGVNQYPYDNSPSYPSYNYNNNNEYIVRTVNIDDSDNTSKKPKSNYGVLYFFAAMGGLVLLSLLLYYGTRDLINNRTRQSQTHSAGAIPETPDSIVHMPLPTTHRGDDDDGDVTVLTSLITPRNVPHDMDNTPKDQFDLPPSYDNSARRPVYGLEGDPSAPAISGCDLPPPSYDEALSNLARTAPPHLPDIAVVPSAPPDVARTTPRNIERSAPVIAHDDL